MVAEPLSKRMMPAMCAVLEGMAEQDYFAESAPDSCSDGFDYYWAPDIVHRKLVENGGPMEWPISEQTLATLSDEDVIRYVEAFYQFVSRPTESWFHNFCGSSHPKAFDTAGGRYDYTVRVNALFDRFECGRRLQGGRVRSSGSSLLSGMLETELSFGNDNHLRSLVSNAVSRFRQSDRASRFAAVRDMADAYERVKTKADASNKRQSVAMLVGALAPHEDLAPHLDAILREMTRISNDATIRHHEVGKVEILDDAELIEFLFYSYYNLVRFALLRGPVSGVDET